MQDQYKTYAIEIVAGVLAIEVASAILDVAGVRQLSNVQLGEESEHLQIERNQIHAFHEVPRSD